MAKYIYTLLLLILCSTGYGQQLSYAKNSLRIQKSKFTCQTEDNYSGRHNPDDYGKNKAAALMLGGGMLAAAGGILTMTTTDTQSRMYKSAQAGTALGIMFFGVGGIATLVTHFQERYALVIERNQLGVAYNFK